MSNELEQRTKAALQQFDSNMAGIFDRKSFYEGDAYDVEAGKPKLNSGQVCFKYTLLSINVLFLIFGIVLMAVGSYALNNEVAELAGATVPAGLIALGVFIMLVALLGALSAWRESRAFLGVYFGFLLIFTIILFAVGIAVYVKRNDSAELITLAWHDAGQDVRLSLQNVIGCCGLTEWNSEGECPPGQQDNRTARTCLPLMVDTFNDSFETAGAVGISFSVIMLGALCFVCYLMNGIKRKSQEAEIARLRSGADNPLGNIDEEAPVQEEQEIGHTQ